jgi:hypothetical protein
VVSFQELKSLVIGVVLVCGVMLAGPLTSHASPADPFAVTAAKASPAKPQAAIKPRADAAERRNATLSAPKISQTAFDLTATKAHDFGDWDHETLR